MPEVQVWREGWLLLPVSEGVHSEGKITTRNFLQAFRNLDEAFLISFTLQLNLVSGPERQVLGAFPSPSKVPAKLKSHLKTERMVPVASPTSLKNQVGGAFIQAAFLFLFFHFCNTIESVNKASASQGTTRCPSSSTMSTSPTVPSSFPSPRCRTRPADSPSPASR